MYETENQDVETEAVAPAVEEHYTQESEALEQSNEQREESDKDYNFRQIRDQLKRQEEHAKKLEQENAEYRKFLLERKQESQPLTQEEKDELEDLAGDDWPTREQTEKITERKFQSLYQKMREKERAEEEKKRQEKLKKELPNMLQQEFSDFDSIVNEQNVQYLKNKEPQIAASLAAMANDPYAQAVAAYKSIKAFVPSAQVTEETRRLERNSSKPQLGGSTSPLSQAKKFESGTISREMKSQLYKEMREASKAF